MMVSQRPNLRWLLLLLVATCQSSLSFAIALIARGAAILPVTTKKTTTSRTHGRTSTSTTELRGGSVVGESAPPPQPTLAQYRNFALPCLALWVAGPLLSLVDTSFVGLASGSNSAAQLAALGPATTFFDGATYLFAFLNVTTTNLYASARAKSGATSANAESVVRTSAKVALRSGLGLMVFLLVCSRPLLKLRSRAYIIQIDCTIL